jgi:DNA repair ATPase RecN
VNKSAQKTQSINRELQKDVVRLQEELGKKQYQAHANLRSIVDKFRTKTKVEIKLATALQKWSEQAAELQVLRADKANRELRGPGF